MEIKTVTMSKVPGRETLGFVLATFEDGAVVVDEVVEGGLASFAGLVKGDQILLINCEPVTGKAHDVVVRMLGSINPVKVTFAFRQAPAKDAIGKCHSVRAATLSFPASSNDLGMAIVTYDEGVVEVVNMADRGPAVDAGISKGDQIVVINDEPTQVLSTIFIYQSASLPPKFAVPPTAQRNVPCHGDLPVLFHCRVRVRGGGVSPPSPHTHSLSPPPFPFLGWCSATIWSKQRYCRGCSVWQPTLFWKHAFLFSNRLRGVSVCCSKLPLQSGCDVVELWVLIWDCTIMWWDCRCVFGICAIVLCMY
jgi:hypothetical protein